MAHDPGGASMVLIGAYGHGREHLRRLDSLARAGRIRLAGVADVRLPDRRQLGLDAGTAVSTDGAELIDRVRPAVVVISTPVHTHAELAATAFAAGAHVLLEKSPTPTLADFDQLLAAQRAAGVACQVGPDKSVRACGRRGPRGGRSGRARGGAGDLPRLPDRGRRHGPRADRVHGRHAGNHRGHALRRTQPEPYVDVVGTAGRARLWYTEDRLRTPAGERQYRRVGLLENLLDHMADSQVPLVAPLAGCRALMQVVEAVRLSPAALPISERDQQVVGLPSGRRRVITGIDELVPKAAEEGRSYAELGAPWAAAEPFRWRAS